MATYVFVGFEGHATATGNATTWANWRKPPGVYHNNGVATADQTIAPPNSAGFGTTILHTGRDSGGKNYGGGYQYKTGVTSPDWAAFRTAKGYQIGIKRSSWGINDEVFATFEISWKTNPAKNLAGFEPTQDYEDIFKWGDLKLRFKSSTYDSGTGHNTAVFAVLNNGVEVATVTVPGIAASTYHFVKVQAKLHATTGLIAVTIDGYAQSVAYTNQNTIATTSLATADHIYVGPMVADNGTDELWCGVIDDIYLGNAFPAGRPIGTLLTFSADGTLSGWAAEGSSPTTVINALSSHSDAKAARGSGVGSSALLTLTATGIASLHNTILGFWFHCFGLSNRDLVAAKKLSVGVSLSGVHTMGTQIAALNLPSDSVGTPPATNYINAQDWVFDPAMGISDWSNIRVRLLVSAA